MLIEGTMTTDSSVTTDFRTAATAAALTATLGFAAVSWVVAVRQMSGMDMGIATRLGSAFSSRGTGSLASRLSPTP